VPAPPFSIVSVAYGKRAVTERCLDSIGQCLGAALGDRVELVLVDNASPDDTATLFDAWRDRATVVSLERNRNFSGGCNAGAQAARGEVLVFLNNDTIVEPGMLEALARQASEPGVGAAGLRLLYLDGTLQHAGVGMIRVPSGHVVPHHLFHHQHGALPAARVSYDLDAVTAACLAIPRDVFLELGGYDEGYANGWEDVDLCLRVRMSGRRVVYRGDLWLWHDEGQTRGQVRGADANAERFYARWGSMLDSDEELVARVFGGRLPARRAVDASAPAPVVVTGLITGVSAASAEARGLLAACRAGAGSAAAQEPLLEMVQADLTDAETAAVGEAIASPVRPGALQIRVSDSGPIPSDAIHRLARMPHEAELPLLAGELPHQAPTVWAASPALRDELIAAGLEPRWVAWLPPCVPTGTAGPGGHGILGILPGHDLERARVAIEALAAAAEQARIRVLPTIASIPLLALVSERLPCAEVLAPCPSNARFRRLALTADVVVCADPDDAFERHALVGAGAGAAVVTTAGGPARAVLGDQAVVPRGVGAGELQKALARALSMSEDREVRAQTVNRLCGERACAQRIRALLRDSSERRAA
jgi:GT2 family glycosyltransferase